LRRLALVLAAAGLVLAAVLLTGQAGVTADSGPVFRIIYTADTVGQLTTCGCSGGQHGGLAKRRTAIWNLSGLAQPPVVLDGGGVLKQGIEAPYFAEAYAYMGYKLVLPAGADLTEKTADGLTLADELRARGVEVLDRDQAPADGPLPSKLLDAGNGWQVLVLAGPDGQVPVEVIAERAKAAVKQAAGPSPQPSPTGRGVHVVVLITRLDPAGNEKLAGLLGDAVDVILGASSPARSRDYRDPIPPGRVIPAIGQGKALTVIDVYEGENGKPRIEARFEPVSPDLLEDSHVREIIDRYYTEAAPASRPESHDEEYQLEWALRGWVDPATCGACHESAYAAWQASAHARAIPTLREKNRLVDECLRCHSEEFRRNGAFDPEHVVVGDGVGCTTCHGPGLAHTASGGKAPIQRGPDESGCMACHTAEQQPAGFQYDESWAKIAHGLDAGAPAH
jgi:hypothetical protein